MSVSIETTVSQIVKPASAETVSVVIPCFNEERYIDKALEQLVGQYDSNRYEIIVVDGLSVDGTRAVIKDFQQRHPETHVRVVDNPARNIPTALNLGVAASSGEIIARMDAHAVPCDGYIARCVAVLAEGRAGAVGMPCMVRPGADTTMARAISAAVSHPFGIGDAKYRLGAGGPQQEPVDTVAFACFRKSLWEELGGFNEGLLTNEDYDFNYRIRQSGREVILDRGGHCDYFARTTLRSLGGQYWRYGGWKAEMIRLQPGSMKLRHAIAPLFVLSLIVLGLASAVWPPVLLLLGAELLLYLLAAIFAGWHAVRRLDGSVGKLVVVMPLVFATIHLTWGLSFLLRLVAPKRAKRIEVAQAA